jgi:hypothetical protein
MIIEINGAVNGFLIVFFVPIILHIKCVFFCSKHQDEEMLVEEALGGESNGR